ncbi:MAG: nucleotidyl transferase AbiEii/AbiGii toxin family protein [Acidimicrobiales bacterium]
MIDIEIATRRVVTDLDELGVGHALVGGLAVSARTEPRFTKDLDLAMSVDDDAGAESAVDELTRRGYAIRATIEHDSGKLATVRLVTPDVAFAADLLFSSSGIEREIVVDAEAAQAFPGVWVPVARTGHLIAVKVLARDDDRRPQDFVDLRALLRVADDGELERARGAIALITERGYARGRDLPAALDELLA